MILSDTDILSALAKVGRLDLLYLFFNVEQLYISPGVLRELEVARTNRFAFSQAIFNQISTQRISVIVLTPSEIALATNLPKTFGAGERESIAAAIERKSILLCNESRVSHWCRRLTIVFFDLPQLLRGFWLNSILTQDEVRQLISDLYTYDNMSISAKHLAAIFAPKK